MGREVIMISEKQLEANRRNAQKSTGPRTEEGKMVVSQNAIKHGILSTLQVLPDVESQEEWERHRAETMADLAPVGYLETVLAGRIAEMLWRLGRAARFEREAMAIAYENAEHDAASACTQGTPKGLKAKSPLKAAEDRVALLEGIVSLLTDLYDAEEDAPVPREQAQWIAKAAANVHGVDLDKPGNDFYRRKNYEAICMAGTVGELRQFLEAAADDDSDESTIATEGIIRRAEEQIPGARAERDSISRLAGQYRRSSLLPGDGEALKIRRHEAHLEKCLYRALHELQRLQAKRGGQMIPPPIVVDLDVNGQQPSN